jgi:transposase
MVLEVRKIDPSLWSSFESVVAKIGCTATTLNLWVKLDKINTDVRDGITSDERERMKLLERENRELRRANEILKLARAFFDQAELDRRLK